MASADVKTAPCKSCGHARSEYAGYGWQITTIAAMTEKASQGCTTCSVFSRGIRQIADSALGPQAVDLHWLRIDFKMAGLSKGIEVALMGTPFKISFFCHSRSPWLSKLMPDLALGREIPPCTSSSESLAWAMGQLDICKRSHKACNALPLSPLPRRVIDVGSSERGKPSYIRLYESQGERQLYVCLSYCWGTGPLLRTLSSNFECHGAEISWAKLSLTHQEAISITRRLGIRYLWIDSLCIIQDDPLDWAQEAAKMATIFENSYLVISATKSPAANGGLFSGPDEKFKTSFVPVKQVDGAHELVGARLAFTHPRYSTASAAPDTATLPTLSRGWIFQERFLAPRVLHFGPEELYWECFESSACQCSGEESISAAYDAAGARVWFKNMLERSARPKAYYNVENWKTMNEEELTSCWHRMVQDYTALRLTHESDIFPAISGLARQFQSILKSDYCAGLWRKSLYKDMLWYASDIGSGRDGHQCLAWGKRPSGWRAPSWSWASVNGPVEFVNVRAATGSSSDIRVVECPLAGRDPTGPVSGGRLLILGCLIRATLSYRAQKNGKDRKAWNLFEIDLAPGTARDTWADYDTAADGPGHVAAGSTVFCLLLAEIVDVPRVAYFVILQRLYEDATERYERIGLLKISGPPASHEQMFMTGEDTLVTVV